MIAGVEMLVFSLVEQALQAEKREVDRVVLPDLQVHRALPGQHQDEAFHKGIGSVGLHADRGDLHMADTDASVVLGAVGKEAVGAVGNQAGCVVVVAGVKRSAAGLVVAVVAAEAGRRNAPFPAEDNPADSLAWTVGIYGKGVAVAAAQDGLDTPTAIRVRPFAEERVESGLSYWGYTSDEEPYRADLEGSPDNFLESVLRH